MYHYLGQTHNQHRSLFSQILFNAKYRSYFCSTLTTPPPTPPPSTATENHVKEALLTSFLVLFFINTYLRPNQLLTEPWGGNFLNIYLWKVVENVHFCLFFARDPVRDQRSWRLQPPPPSLLILWYFFFTYSIWRNTLSTNLVSAVLIYWINVFEKWISYCTTYHGK